jgi:hypothetical protein
VSLDDLFRCPAIGKALAVKACLRRQDEPKQRPECQGCAVGVGNRAACDPLPVVAAVEGPVLPGRPLPPVFLWAGEVPDVPLGAPPASGAKPDPSYGITGRPPKRRFVGGLLFEADELEPDAPHTEVEKQVVAQEPPEITRNIPRHIPTPPAPLAPVTQHQEEPMAAHPPCPKCKSSGRHRSDCPRLAEIAAGKGKPAPAKPAAAPPRAVASPRPPRREREGFSVLDEVQELQGRARDRLAEIEAEVGDHKAAIGDLGEEAEQLRNFLGLDRAVPARAVG